MSLQYIIDGYNIVRHPSFSYATGIKDAKTALIMFIKTRRLCGSQKNKVTVVFDGNPNVLERKLDNTDINVIFTHRETADGRIKRMVEASGNPKNIVVVSDDKEIKFFIKSLRARSLGVEEFISRKEKKQDLRKNGLIKTELTYSQMHKINQELKKIWLK